ncbi:D-alanyl-D-alanine carboxypeptidase family protein [Anaerotruncus rubiinfantis]|uniref:D-alanyl-D-alanine carboxypeptidase family protein n=1 Tax=Anaerotruncus rubiinfantis TaxID=1720200 RepID=UPI003D78E481
MLRRIAAALLALMLAGGTFVCGARAEEVPAAAQTIPNTRDYETKAKGAVVIDAQTGRVLFAQNANLRLPMASTTKIMTALITLEQENLDEYFTVDPAAIKVEGSSMGLREGDQVSLSALAYGMLLPSGNDGANAAAVRIAGSKEAFAKLMNERAAEIGLEDTHFVTPSGLDDSEHYSSAYDMALLAREALGNPRFADICSQYKAVAQYGNPPYNRWLQNHNRLLRSYEGAVGVKTGFTDTAGRCLVSCAMRGGVKLIAVTLGCPDDWNTHANLYDRYFERLTPTDVEPAIPEVNVPVAGGETLSVKAVYEPQQKIPLFEGESLTAQTVLRPLLFAPVEKGEVLGRVVLSCDGQKLSEITLTAAKSVPAREDDGNSLIGFFQRLIGF